MLSRLGCMTGIVICSVGNTCEESGFCHHARVGVQRCVCGADLMLPHGQWTALHDWICGSCSVQFCAKRNKQPGTRAAGPNDARLFDSIDWIWRCRNAGRPAAVFHQRGLSSRWQMGQGSGAQRSAANGRGGLGPDERRGQVVGRRSKKRKAQTIQRYCTARKTYATEQMFTLAAHACLRPFHL